MILVGSTGYAVIGTTEGKVIEIDHTNCNLRRTYTYSTDISALEYQTSNYYFMAKEDDANVHLLAMCVAGQKLVSGACQACTPAVEASNCDSCYGTNRLSDCSCPDNYYSVYLAGN